MSQGMWVEGRKGKKMDSPLELLENSIICGHLDFNQKDPCQTFNLQNGKNKLMFFEASESGVLLQQQQSTRFKSNCIVCDSSPSTQMEKL